MKPKFGEKTAANEREFRQFFDKIIQLPFSMPVASYDIDNFLINSLRRIEFLSLTEIDDDTFKRDLTTFVNLSIGKNPRSLKRLLNSLSLMRLVATQVLGGEKITELDKKIHFALVCIQICYPTIYNVLVMHNDFTKWDSSLIQESEAKVLTSDEAAYLKTDQYFDESWEQILYCICRKEAFLLSHVRNICKIFNSIRDLIVENEKNKQHTESQDNNSGAENSDMEIFNKMEIKGVEPDVDVGAIIKNALFLSNITNVTPEESPGERHCYNNTPVMQKIVWGLKERFDKRGRGKRMELLSRIRTRPYSCIKFSDSHTEHALHGRRTAFVLELQKQGKEHFLDLRMEGLNGWSIFYKTQFDQFEEAEEHSGKKNVLSKVLRRIKDLNARSLLSFETKIERSVFQKEDGQYLTGWYCFKASSEEELYSSAFLDELFKFLDELFDITAELYQLKIAPPYNELWQRLCSRKKEPFMHKTIMQRKFHLDDNQMDIGLYIGMDHDIKVEIVRWRGDFKQSTKDLLTQIGFADEFPMETKHGFATVFDDSKFSRVPDFVDKVCKTLEPLLRTDSSAI